MIPILLTLWFVTATQWTYADAMGESAKPAPAFPRSTLVRTTSFTPPEPRVKPVQEAPKKQEPAVTPKRPVFPSPQCPDPVPNDPNVAPQAAEITQPTTFVAPVPAQVYQEQTYTVPYPVYQSQEPRRRGLFGGWNLFGGGGGCSGGSCGR